MTQKTELEKSRRDFLSWLEPAHRLPRLQWQHPQQLHKRRNLICRHPSCRTLCTHVLT